MADNKYYRSPIDKLVVESGIKATLIAQYMQIKYHRMVALRRLKDVHELDIKLCKKAIEDIKQSGIKYRKASSAITEKPESVKSETESVKLTESKPATFKENIQTVVQSKKMELSQQARSLSYLLGQTINLLTNVFDSLQINGVPIPGQILERHKQLIEQCNKLLNV